MAGLGIIVAWFGYSVLYYGLDTVKGGNDSFISLIWPGRYAPTARDDGTGGSSSSPTPSGAASSGSLGNFKTCANPANWINLKCNVPCILFGKLC